VVIIPMLVEQRAGLAVISSRHTGPSSSARFLASFDRDAKGCAVGTDS
jgi:hypothetical protein